MDHSPSQHNHGGLSKLLPSSLSAKRQRSKRNMTKSPSKNGEESLDPDSSRGRGRTLKNRGTGDRRSVNEEDSDDRSFGSNGSSLSLSQGRESSSTRSRPSTSPQPQSRQQPQQQQQRQPSPHPVRPVPSTHPSLIGYLTTSSPVVQAEHLDSAAQVQPARVASRSPSGRSATVSTSSPLKEIPDNNNAPSLGAPILEPPAPVKVASPTKSPRPKPKVELEAPKTPPTADRDSPVIVNTPPTPTDHSHAFLPPSPERRGPAGSRSPTDGSSPTRVINSHRRSKSGSATIVPSKLSTITAAPLTPTPETGEAASSNQGFFSTVFSAAQNAATTLSSNIPGAGIGIGGSRKSSANIAKSQTSSVQSVPDLDLPDHDASATDMSEKRNSAIHTLGTGELSLSQLGLADPPPGGANGTTPASAAAMKFPDVIDSRTRSESAPVELNTPELDQGEHLQPGSRPRSIAESPSAEDLSGISQSELADTPATVQRSTSVRSAMKAHRKRGSSTNNGAIAAGISATAVAPIASPPKLTGFAIASKKRNRDFHSFFKSVPDDDYLIEDYSCALQREILAHGRLYVSEGHLCFSSNILGWTTTLVMSFDEIVSVEKRSTALVFKNGLMISTLHAKHIFASFTSRDATYDLIVNIWKLGHPTLKSTLNGVQLEGTGGDKTEKIDSEPLGLGIDNEILAGSDSEELSDENSDEDDEDEFYDEEEHHELIDTQPTEVSGADGDAEKPPFRKVSTMSTANGQSPDAQKETPSSPGGATDFPGPAAHPPTDCGDSASHYDKFLLDEIVPAPLGKVYSLVFGSASPNYMSKWLANDQKCWDVEMEDKKGLSLDNKTRTYSYIKPLYASLGPKQTKCIVSETVENLDYEKAININGSTQTPDVPSGSLFTVKTKYCLSWAENNATRFQINCTVEWSGKSWIKGPVEKGVSDGQGQYCKDLFAGLKAAVSRARANTGANGAGKKKKSRKSKANAMSREADEEAAKRTGATKANWGPLEPVRPVLEPVVDILKPVLTGNVMYGLLVGLLVASWFGFGFSPSRNTPAFGHDLDLFGPYRTAAYEEMWRREESELWDWLEERVGLERLNEDGIQSRRRAAEPRTMEERLREERMDNREVNEAIRVTEEKLKILRQVVSKSKQSHGAHSEL